MTEHLGFIGLGNMGGPMAANLLRAGNELIVHDARPAAANALCAEGARWAEDPGAVARASGVVLTSLPGPKQIEDVAFGAAGLFPAWRSGILWIDMSTNDPALTRRLADAARERGGAFVDAPVTGGVLGARNASLTIMAGGGEHDVARARPVLRTIGAEVVHTGPAGSGCAMKLIVNFLGITHTALAGEALALGRAGGLTAETMLAVLAGCWGDNGMLDDIVRTAGDARDWGFAQDLAKKDMALAARLAEDQGLSSRYAEVTHAILEETASATHSADDLWRVVEACEHRAGVSIVGES